MFKGDNKIFYITLALIGVLGVITIVLIKNKKAEASTIPSLKGCDDDYIKKAEIDIYVKRLLQDRTNPVPVDLTMLQPKYPAMSSPEQNAWEGNDTI